MPSVIDKNRPCKQQPQKMDVLIALPIVSEPHDNNWRERQTKKRALAISQRKELVPIVTLPLFTRLFGTFLHYKGEASFRARRCF
jgi:hypothetical protein